MACEFSQRPAVFVCDSAWEMDLPSAQRRGVELLFLFFRFFFFNDSQRQTLKPKPRGLRWCSL